MSNPRKELQEDPLSLFVFCAEAEDISNRAKVATISISQKHAQTMSRIGAPPSDLFAESLSFEDPLSRNTARIECATKILPAGNHSLLQSHQRISTANILDEIVPMQPSKHVHKNPNVSEWPSPTNFLQKVVQTSSQRIEKYSEQASIVPVMITSEPSFRPEERSLRGHGLSTSNFIEIGGDSVMKYLSGEMYISSVNDVKVQVHAGRALNGVLVLTNYRLKLFVSEKLLNSMNSPSLFSFLNVPLGCIDKIEKEKKTKEQKTYEQKLFNSHCSNSINSNITILVTCKDMRMLRITLPYNNIINGTNGSIYNNINHNVALDHQNSGINNVNENDIENFIQTVAELAFPNNRRMLFAFAHGLNRDPIGKGNNNPNALFNGNDLGNNVGQMSDGIKTHTASSCLSSFSSSSSPYLEPYCILKELKRQKVLDIYNVTEKPEMTSLFRISTVNSNYHLCSTYPALLVVPRKMSDEELVQSANFRSGHRLPVLCWGDSETGVTMWRSSQPKSGVSGACAADEKLLDLIAQSCVYKRTPLGGLKIVGDPLLCIVDCRPKASALANKAAGAGYESQSNYPNSQIYFNNIGNIHVMRESYNNLCSLLLSPIPIMNDINFTKHVEDTNYLTNIRLLLKCSLETVFMLKKNLPVLVHCSHGWDRTAQITALTQLFLDPYYRTIDGFKILIEKEFLSFGHQFFLRCGHGLNNSNNSRNNYSNNSSNNHKGFNSSVKQEDQLSPIFFQFLDCTWQLLKQHIHYFEFNSRYLLTLADHIHSCRFGTFLFDSDLERESFQPREACADIWTYLQYNRKSLTNPLYMDPHLEDTATTHSLIPPLSQLLRNVTLWTDYFFRYCPLPTIIVPPTQLSRHLYKSGVTVSCSEHEEGDTCQYLFHPGRSLSSAGTVSPSQLFPCTHQDFELPAMVTSDDFWEAAVRCEGDRVKGVAKIEALTAKEGSSVAVCTIPQQVMPLRSLSAPSSSQVTLCQQGTSTESGEECEDKDMTADLNLARQRNSRHKFKKLDVKEQKVMIKRLLTLLRSKGCTSEDLEFCLEFESENGNESDEGEASSGSSSDSIIDTDTPSHDAASDEEAKLSIVAVSTESVFGDHAEDQYLNIASCNIKEKTGTLGSDSFSIRGDIDNSAVYEQSDCLVIITDTDLFPPLKREDLIPSLNLTNEDRLAKLSSSDLLSALTSTSPMGERKLFGSPKLPEEIKLFTNTRIVGDEITINEF